ncbi:MAG: ACP S-malonyltransferase [Bacteroidales bacterium]|nr:ACP S-malonyltransferase [Bacteroidales bacterium]
MKKVFVFPGQGTQFTGMARDLYDNNPLGRKMLEEANEILGFRITDIMFEGSDEDLKATKVTQPAVFLHSVVMASCIEGFTPDMAAGHSLGEFSALTACGALSFEDGLKLVSIRAMAMQKACEAKPSGMAAVIGLNDDSVIENICAATPGIVVAANYNCPGQVVISGELDAIAAACEALKAAGARRALPLAVGGAFHSPLMEPAREELAQGIEAVRFNEPVCPVYQNVTGAPSIDPTVIKDNLLKQLTAPVRWKQSVEAMIADGATSFTELGPGKVLQGMIKKIGAAVVGPDFEEKFPITGSFVLKSGTSAL